MRIPNSKISGMLKKWAIEYALTKPVPASIPRTMPRVASVNCIAIHFENKSLDWKFLLETKNESSYSGILWEDDQGEGAAFTLPMNILNDKEFKINIEHYYKGWCFEYPTLLRFLIGTMTLKHLRSEFFRKFSQYIYNQKTIIRSERIELLKFVVEESLSNPEQKISHIELGTMLHSNRWIFHPKQDQYATYMLLLLESLVASGDLDQDGIYFSVKAHALATISIYDGEEQKHQDNLRSARESRKLTFALVTITFLHLLFLVWLEINKF